MKKIALLEVINRKSLGKKEEPQIISLLVRRVTKWMEHHNINSDVTEGTHHCISKGAKR